MWVKIWQVPRTSPVVTSSRISTNSSSRSAPGLPVLRVAEGRGGAVQLRGERLAVGGQVGEAAAGQLGHLVEMLKVRGAGRADTVGHWPLLPESRSSTSAESAARSASDGTIMYSCGEWIAPPRTPIVSTTATPECRDVVAIADPARTLPADLLTQRRAAFAHQIEQLFSLRRQGLGRTADPAVEVDTITSWRQFQLAQQGADGCGEAARHLLPRAGGY